MDPQRYIAMMNVKEIQKEAKRKELKNTTKTRRKIRRIDPEKLRSLCVTKKSKFRLPSPKIRRRKIVKAPINNEKFKQMCGKSFKQRIKKKFTKHDMGLSQVNAS